MRNSTANTNRAPVAWKRCRKCGRGYAGKDGLDPGCRAMLARTDEEREIAALRKRLWTTTGRPVGVHVGRPA